MKDHNAQRVTSSFASICASSLSGLWFLITGTQSRPSRSRAHPGLNDAIPLGLNLETVFFDRDKPLLMVIFSIKYK